MFIRFGVRECRFLASDGHALSRVAGASLKSALFFSFSLPQAERNRSMANLNHWGPVGIPTKLQRKTALFLYTFEH